MSAKLGEPVKVQDWLIAGLPNDAFSIENGIMIANARRWPLAIDPQGQANKWIKNMEKAHNLQVIKLTAGGEYVRVLENAIQFGLPVLLENVGEELDPTLEPLLLKQIFKQGGVNCIRLGDNTIEYSSEFRFYITSKMRNPHYLPEVAVKVTLLNFMITLLGLADQLLGVVVATERPDLDEQRTALVIQSADNSRKLKEIEDQILEVLSSSEGNILEDESAIQIITAAKSTSNDIAEKQALAEVTEKEIEVARVMYQPCGAYTSILFFCISDLAELDPMYQYSLPWFVNLFVNSITLADAAPDVPTRLEHIHAHFTYALFCNVCRSLFEKDKLLFAFLLCSRILESKGQVDGKEWLFLLTGGLGDAGNAPNPAPDWLNDRAWRELCKLSLLPSFAGLKDAVARSPAEWRPLYESTRPHTVTLPGHYTMLDTFQRLMVTRCIRPDKITPAVQDYVKQHMGQRYVEPPPFNLDACYQDSTATTPLIFVLSAGSDPTAALLQFATEKEMDGRMHAISLGQGQGPKAAAIIAQGAVAGDWVVLQNCHLAPSWMQALDKIAEDLTPADTHPEFRLWMTSYPSPKFPVNILQNGVKMTNEPPKGVRANMKRSLTLEPVAQEEFFGSANAPQNFKRLLFGLIFFHAVIQERRKFGPLGWNIPYGFDDGDWRISVRQLLMFLNENEEVPFDALRYVTGECNYGGRVTDDKDRRLLSTLLAQCYAPALLTDDGYKLSESGCYRGDWGPNATLPDLTAFLDTLPILPEPEAFGLHANADISKDQNETAALFAALLQAGGGSGGGGGGAADVEARVGAAVTLCMARLPPLFDIECVSRKFPVSYEESMNTVLTQEMVRFNRLLQVMIDSLRNIDLAIKGLLVMSSDLEAAYQAISLNQIPAIWAKASYPSLKPLGSYLEDLYCRLKMLQDWYEVGMPVTYWLSGFFFVQSFLTAGLQNYARKHKMPIDMVSYEYEMLGTDERQYTERPEAGVYTYGLYLEGCAWDPATAQLCESQPKTLFVTAPCMYLKPMETSAVTAYPHYACPVYRTAERRGVLATTGHSTNFISFIKMPTALPESHWVMRGVAMLSQLSD